MAIKFNYSSKPLLGTTKTYDYIITTSSIPSNTTGITSYVGSIEKIYDEEIESVTTSKSNVTAKLLSSKRVKYLATSGSAGMSVTFTATIKYKGTTINEVITNSGVSINYIKTKSNNKYIWTKPTEITLRLPWTFFRTWELYRTASINPEAENRILASNSTMSPSNTDTISIPGAYYGDTLELGYTLKPGGTVSVENGTEITVDPSFSIQNTGSTQLKLLEPTITYTTGDLGFKKPEKADLRDGTNTQNFKLVVTKPTELSNFDVDISVQDNGSESYYIIDQLIGWSSVQTDTYCDIYKSDGTKITITSYTSLGSIPAGTTSGEWTLYVNGGDKSTNKASPKFVDLNVKMTIAGKHSSDHKFKTSSGWKRVYVGEETVADSSGGGSGGGGWVGPATGGWMAS